MAEVCPHCESATCGVVTCDNSVPLLRVITHCRNGVTVLLKAARGEIDRLKNAAKSRLKCPDGHAPGQSRGPCWFCDAERNAAGIHTLRHWAANVECLTSCDLKRGKSRNCTCGAVAERETLSVAVAILDGKVKSHG